MKCPNCGKETRVGDRFCVECGASLVPPGATSWWKIFSAVAAGVLVAFIVLWATCSMCSGEESIIQEGLQIVSHEGHVVARFWGGFEVTGIAKNMGTEKLNYVEIDCRFYDAVGNEVDTSFDWTSDLDPGQSWGFKFESLDWRAQSYDLSVGDCW